MGVRRHARVRARVPRRALRGRPARRPRASRGRAPCRAAGRPGGPGRAARDPEAGAAEDLMGDESRQELAEPEEELRIARDDGASPRDEGGGADLEELAAEALEDETEDFEERGAALLRDRRRIAGLVAAVVLLVIAIYVILPKIVGLNNVLDRLSDATWYWVVIGSRSTRSRSGPTACSSAACWGAATRISCTSGSTCGRRSTSRWRASWPPRCSRRA